jgi:peptide/nickel transport system substrate-binding protein
VRISSDQTATSNGVPEVGITVEMPPLSDRVPSCKEWRLGIPDRDGIPEISWGMSCDAWTERLPHSGTEARRAENYRAAHRLVMTDLPLLPVRTATSGAGVHGPRVRDVRVPRQNWHDVTRVRLDVSSAPEG